MRCGICQHTIFEDIEREVGVERARKLNTKELEYYQDKRWWGNMWSCLNLHGLNEETAKKIETEAREKFEVKLTPVEFMYYAQISCGEI